MTSVERQALVVLMHEQRADQAGPLQSALHDLVAARRAREVTIAELTNEPLARVQADEDLLGFQLDHRGGLWAKGVSFSAAAWARALRLGHLDGVGLAAEVRRDLALPPWPSRLGVGLGCSSRRSSRQ